MTSISKDAPLAVQQPQQSAKALDAGLKAVDHYKQRLPAWRHRLRQQLIPAIRKETPYLARFQSACRSPFLDSYFAITANLGTHTFYMAALPVCFYCGFPSIGMALIHMLALGVYFSGCLKDALCLPRPLSPPLQRITMSPSAALEYGLPSTHTTNAVSVTIFCLYQLELARPGLSPLVYYAYQAMFWLYIVSISVGRLYCGMHGFMDVIVGGLIGAAAAWLRIACGTAFDQWILEGDSTRPIITSIILVTAVRFHAEPADDCPCFDDSVAFLGVVLGMSSGSWSYGQHMPVVPSIKTLDNMYPYTNSNIIKSVARVVGGIATVFIWRAVMKPILLKILPPIFRFVDQRGLRLPRRYFLQARDYGKVPKLPKDDNVLPPASKISGMLTTLPNPRKRTISVGPQSEADVREFIANRAQARRNSRSERSSSNTRRPDLDAAITDQEAVGHDPVPSFNIDDSALSSKEEQEQQAREDKQEEQENQKMFDALKRPRVRYDVEVITKLIIYTGIAWFVVEGNPMLFSLFGLA